MHIPGLHRHKVMRDEDRLAFSERLNQALDDVGFPKKGDGRQVKLAKLFGLNQKGVRKWLEGEGTPTFERTKKLAESLNVTVEWLMTGHGPKRLKDVAVRRERVVSLEFGESEILALHHLAQILGVHSISDAVRTVVSEAIRDAAAKLDQELS